MNERSLEMNKDEKEAPSGLLCETCQRPLERPPHAPHKRFCSTKCRNAWHSVRRAEGAKLLKEQALKELT